MKDVKQELRKIPYLFLLMLFSCLNLQAQGLQVRGVVVDSNGESIIGAVSYTHLWMLR